VTERAVLFTGVGGQGVQICSKTLATAANGEDRYCMLIARYDGGMRGGMTNAEVTVGDAPLRALPITPAAWAAFVMSPAYWHTVSDRLQSDAVVVVNSSLVTVTPPDARLFEVPANDIAASLGNPLSAGFVLLGAFAALTGLVTVDGAVDAMRQLVPPYRTEHLQANEAALRAGGAAVPELAAPAWPVEAVTP
jgi:Pyruvate/2-oxoacid:ferredoxin oxidoreductase gamma subunit